MVVADSVRVCRWASVASSEIRGEGCRVVARCVASTAATLGLPDREGRRAGNERDRDGSVVHQGILHLRVGLEPRVALDSRLDALNLAPERRTGLGVDYEMPAGIVRLLSYFSHRPGTAAYG